MKLLERLKRTKLNTFRNKTIASTLVAILAIPLLPIKTNAQIGVGSLVFDPSTYAEMGEVWSSDLSILAKAIDEVAILAQVYINAVQLFNLATFMSQMVASKNFAGAFSIAAMTIPPNMGGRTGTWGPGVNGNGDPMGGWSAATIPLQTHPLMLPGSPWSAHFASAEINSGAGVSAMTALGATRVAQILFQDSANTCETNAMSFAPGDNTQIAQLNMSNGCQSMMLRQSQSQMALSTAIVDMQVANMKMQTDFLVDNLNMLADQQQIVFTDLGGEVIDDWQALAMHVDR